MGYAPIYVYFATVLLVTLATLASSFLFPSKTDEPNKFKPYESGIQTETHLFKERFYLRHYLVGLMFLIFDVEALFLYPWAVIAKKIGPFAFYELLFFILTLLVGFAYMWKKGGLEWE